MTRKRTKTYHEIELRRIHRERKNFIERLERLGIAYYDVNSDNPELYATPNNFICVFSPNEMEIGDDFSESMNEEAIFIALHDYNEFILD